MIIPPNIKDLVSKYNVATPRYTSYPTVPYWDMLTWSADKWLQEVRHTFLTSEDGSVSVYVHLPYCERLCTYCGCNTRISKNHQVEQPYIASVLKEWEMYKTQLTGGPIVIGELHLGGGTPTFFSAENLRQLITGLLDGVSIHEKASFSFEAHPANTTSAHLGTLYDLGFRRLSLGVQDFDPRVQEVINRKQTEDDINRVVLEARALGYTSINFDLIYGLPLQTPASVQDTVEKSIALRPDRISFYSYAHVPWLKPGQRRYTEMDLPAGSDKLALYNLGKELILAAGYHDVGMDHFSLPADELHKSLVNGTLHRNFMGYTDRHTSLLIGLGVSSISDAWGAFAQNVKSVEEYHALIHNGEFPVVKGHILSKEDLLLRRHILDVMCLGKTTLRENGVIDNGMVKARMEPLVCDGLVEIIGDTIQVTPTGKSFLRNICTAFDHRMITQKEKEQLFSQAV